MNELKGEKSKEEYLAFTDLLSSLHRTSLKSPQTHNFRPLKSCKRRDNESHNNFLAAPSQGA
ncbi:hypothetical protein MtrunA17_Chr7g0228381 [Medicago truncatula]|uniref:Uncharacterized protein n=1 Tax=Medicago truncatula TaxID=3880 RepID=A0A396GYF3_MEDTR|nr:hypothetical protein MtrunA17_Chr7g0228381 [Medicago truncatula]